MKTVYLISPGKIEIRDVNIPKPGEGEVVIQVKSALTCGTDLKTYIRGHPKFKPPMPFGHECSGVIYSIGSGVKKFKEGDQVMLANSAPCGKCYYCHRGVENLCVNLFDNLLLGAYSEYVKVPAEIVKRNMFIKPENISFVQASFLEPLSCVMHGVSNVNLNKDDYILIIGAGSIGLMFLLVLKKIFKMNGNVIIAGRRREKLEIARRFKADFIIDIEIENLKDRLNEITGGIGPGIIFECTGVPDVWEEAIELTSKAGTVILFGGCPPGTKVQFNATRIHYDQLTIKGIFHFTPEHVRRAYEFLTTNDASEIANLITGKFKIDRIEEAFKLLAQKRGIKYEIVP